MIIVFLNLCLASFMAAFFAVVYVRIMPSENITNWWFNYGFRKFGPGSGKESFFYKPIWGCEKCVAGQIAFWWFVYSATVTNLRRDSQLLYTGGYNVVAHFFCVTLAILLALVIAKIFKHFQIIE